MQQSMHENWQRTIRIQNTLILHAFDLDLENIVLE